MTTGLAVCSSSQPEGAGAGQPPGGGGESAEARGKAESPPTLLGRQRAGQDENQVGVTSLLGFNRQLDTPSPPRVLSDHTALGCGKSDWRYSRPARNKSHTHAHRDRPQTCTQHTHTYKTHMHKTCTSRGA